MKVPFRQIVLHLISVIFGFALGLSFSHFHRPPPPESERPEQREKEFIDRFAAQFNLSEAQQKRTMEIVETSRTDIEAFRKKTYPEFEALRKKVRSQIREMLNAEQRVKYDKIYERKPPAAEEGEEAPPPPPQQDREGLPRPPPPRPGQLHLPPFESAH